jgi:hypothetical protein
MVAVRKSEFLTLQEKSKASFSLMIKISAAESMSPLGISMAMRLLAVRK